jgi:hypothetical protein
MLALVKRLVSVALLSAAVLSVSACCNGTKTNPAATAKCKTNSISAENCKNCCKAYGATSSSYTVKGSCTCR